MPNPAPEPTGPQPTAAARQANVRRSMSKRVPMSRLDSEAIKKAVDTARAAGRRVIAVEVNPTRRLEAGAWEIDGVPLISNGLVPLDRFDLKVEGRVLALDTLEERFFSDAHPQ